MRIFMIGGVKGTKKATNEQFFFAFFHHLSVFLNVKRAFQVSLIVKLRLKCKFCHVKRSEKK